MSIIVRFSFRGARQFDDKCRKFPAYLQLSREGNSRQVAFELYRMYTGAVMFFEVKSVWRSLRSSGNDKEDATLRKQKMLPNSYVFLTFKIHYLIREAKFGGKCIHFERKAKGFNAFRFLTLNAWP